MMRELTAKELAAVYEGTLVNVDKEDTYGVAIDLSRAKISYDEDFNELTFTGDGYEITFKDDDYFKDNTIDCITYDDETQEAMIEFDAYVPPVTIRKWVEMKDLLKALQEKEAMR